MKTESSALANEAEESSDSSLSGAALLNALEPHEIIASFNSFPPEGFLGSKLSNDGSPCFVTKFDLLTTLEEPVKSILSKIPFFKSFSKLFLTPRTLFVGTTVSEYARVAADSSPQKLIESIKRDIVEHKASVAIIKDLPCESPLLTESENRAAKDILEYANKSGFVTTAGQALAYVPIDFESIEKYLSRLSSSRRKDLRRKMKSREELSLKILSTGSVEFSHEEFIQKLYSLYLQVYDQSEIHFDKLQLNFFRSIFQSHSANGKVFLYSRYQKLIGFNLCFEFEGRLIDKYIGLSYPDARETNLYFLSWFYNLEYAIANKLTHYVAGWTDPKVKAALGAKFTMTQHAVYFKNPILRAALKPLRPLFEADQQFVADSGSEKS